MTKDRLSSLAGIVVALVSTLQTAVPADTPLWVRAALAAVSSALGVWTGTKAYKPLSPEGR